MRKLSWLHSGLMRSTAIDQFLPASICSIEAEGAAAPAGGGGAGDIFEEGGGTSTPTPTPTPTPPGSPPAAPPPPPAAPPAWAEGLSAEAVGEGQASNRDYVTAKGFKDTDALVGSYRELERAIAGGKGYLKVPGEGASDAEVAAYRTARGVPGAAADYVVNLPKAGDGEPAYELDTTLLEPLKEAALKGGVSSAEFAALGDAFVQYQLDGIAADNRDSNAEAKTFFDKQGKDAPAARANALKGAQLVGFSRDEIVAIQNARTADGRRIGADNLLEKLAKLGALAGEDVLEGGERLNFGVSSAADAQAQIDAMQADPEKARKLRARDPALKATYDRLLAAVTHFKELESKR